MSPRRAVSKSACPPRADSWLMYRRPPGGSMNSSSHCSLSLRRLCREELPRPGAGGADLLQDRWSPPSLTPGDDTVVGVEAGAPRTTRSVPERELRAGSQGKCALVCESAARATSAATAASATSPARAGHLPTSAATRQVQRDLSGRRDVQPRLRRCKCSCQRGSSTWRAAATAGKCNN